MTHPANGQELEHTAQIPDTADWLHIQETVKLLLLSMAQIELTLTDGEHNVTGLGQYFTHMAAHLRSMNQYLDQRPDTPAEIAEHGHKLEAQINEGVIAFQFYDRLSQRLQHVVTGLALTEDLLCDKQRRLSSAEWTLIHQQIKGSYSLDCERKMFELVLQGMPLHQALALYRDEHLYRKDDIELF